MRCLARFFSLALVASTLAYAQKPALVQNVDEKGRVPYLQQYSASCARGQYECAVAIPVPAGQRLVVTHVNGLFRIDIPELSYVVLSHGTPLPAIEANGDPEVSLVLSATDLGNSVVHKYNFDRDVTFYADGVNNAQLYFTFSLNEPTNLHGAASQVSVAGYLIPLPAGSTN